MVADFVHLQLQTQLYFLCFYDMPFWYIHFALRTALNSVEPLGVFRMPAIR
jgi:hypothetical protein